MSVDDLIRSATKIKFRPGDVVVLEHPGRLSVKHAENIRKCWEESLPGVRLIVLEEGMTLKAVFSRESGVTPDHIIGDSHG